jgi:energy-coupling factor transporter ATP-binding protein EcfA2
MAAKKRPTKTALSPVGGYFASITVRDIRCFGPEQTLNLLDSAGNPARWTVLLGDNGVGKTTLLQALAIVAPIKTPDFIKERKVNGLRPEMAEAFETMRDGPAVQAYFAFGLFGGGLIRNQISVTKSFALSGNIHYKSSIDAIGKGEAISSNIFSDGKNVTTGIPQFPIFCVGYGASRRIGAGSLDVAKDNPFASLFDDDAPLRNAEEWLILADYAASKESSQTKKARAATELERVKEALIALLPDVHDIRVELNMRPGGVPRVEAKTDDGWIALRDLSLGYRATMAWMIDLAARMFEAYPNSKNPLAEPAVVLVDEIDLHLHPKWQRDLLARLTERFPQTQFIATAHSPLVVQAAPDANIAVLRRKGDHVIIDQDAGSVRGWRVDQILTSDLFGLPSARDPAQDELRQRREAILGKSRLTRADKAELSRIEAKLVDAPGGESPQQIEAMNIIMRAASSLEKAREGEAR